MNAKISKKLRSIINPEDAITRRVYRRAKEQYKKVPKNLKKQFLASLEDHMLGVDSKD